VVGSQGKKGETVQSRFSLSTLSCPRTQLTMSSRSCEAGSAGLPAVIEPVGLESSVIALIEMFLSEIDRPRGWWR
jgi:hypothetical protein